MKRAFTVTDGLNVQADQLEYWRAILNPKAFAALKMEAKKQNAFLTLVSTGDDIWRGNDIDMFVMNLALKTASANGYVPKYQFVP